MNIELSWIEKALNFIWLVLIPFIWKLRGEVGKLVNQEQLEKQKECIMKELASSNENIIKQFGRSLSEEMAANQKIAETMEEMNSKLTVIEKSLLRQEIEEEKNKEIIEKDKEYNDKLKSMELESLNKIIQNLDIMNKKYDRVQERLNQHQGILDTLKKG